VITVQGAQTRKARVDDPQFVVVIIGHLVDIDVAGDVDAAREITSVVLARRFYLGRDRGHVAVVPNGVRATDGEPCVIGCDAHGSGERAKVRI
jgi:hypothetical protein